MKECSKQASKQAAGRTRPVEKKKEAAGKNHADKE
jgi:hypothetical protein